MLLCVCVYPHRNIQVFMDWMQAQDPVAAVPSEFVMAARVNILLRGIGAAFGLRMRVAPTWAPAAERLLLTHAPERLRAIRERRQTRATAAAAAAAGGARPALTQ